MLGISPEARRQLLAVPEAPGLGIEIDEAAAAKYPFAQEIIPALDSVLWDGRIANW